MHVVVFGLCISSSWGNGHATLWRGLVKALVARGHTITFYEKDVPYYAETRDGWQPPLGARVRIYGDLKEISSEITPELGQADLALTTSYCPDGAIASSLLFDSRAAIKAFYDLDTPVTLDAVDSGIKVPYLPPDNLRGFDLVLSYTGGRALLELESRLGARRVAPLYGWVDLEAHHPADPMAEFRSTLSYLGTFARDRQHALEELFLRPAASRPAERLAIAGAQYPADFPWTQNTFFVRHLPPRFHPAFFCSSRATLNITRRAMAEYGYCPSGRLFEAAACGVPIFTDWWQGLDRFFDPKTEILPVESAQDVLDALSLSEKELNAYAAAARSKTLECHTALHRVLELEAICNIVGDLPSTPALVA